MNIMMTAIVVISSLTAVCGYQLSRSVDVSSSTRYFSFKSTGGDRDSTISADKIAVLIDGDNAESSLVAEFIAEAGRFGKVTVKRCYGDWTSPQMKTWKEQLNSYAVRPIQKFAYTKNKGSTDTALIIDAMDMLHSKLVDGFCIVSSDSDYTGLAHRIREEGQFIMGIGKKHTPEAFCKACESFTYSEILASSVDEDNAKFRQKRDKIYKEANTTIAVASPATAPTTTTLNIADNAENTVRNIDFHQVNRAFRIAVNIDNGKAKMSRLADELRKLDPTFDHRNFGFSSFKKFCDALNGSYETFMEKDGTTLVIMERSNKDAEATPIAEKPILPVAAAVHEKEMNGSSPAVLITQVLPSTVEQVTPAPSKARQPPAARKPAKPKAKSNSTTTAKSRASSEGNSTKRRAPSKKAKPAAVTVTSLDVVL